MLVINSQIPDIVGHECIKLLCQQFWLSGVLTTEVTAIFMCLDDGSWHKFFFDHGVLFWKKMSPVSVTQFADEFHYPCVDLCSRFSFCGHTVKKIATVDNNDEMVELRIHFSNLNVLVLREDAGEMLLEYESDLGV